MTGVLYRAFDADGTLLYVGATSNPGERLNGHRHGSDWWTDASTIRLEHFPTREAAFAAESAAILAEKPRMNLARPGAPLSVDQLESRRAARQRNREEYERRRDANFSPGGTLACANCGTKPRELPKRVLIKDMRCPKCDCATIVPVTDTGSAA